MITYTNTKSYFWRQLFRVLWTIAAVCFLLGFLFCLSGCSMSRQARTVTAENISTTQNRTIERALESAVIPNVTVSGSSNTVTIAPPYSKGTLSVVDVSAVDGSASGDVKTASKFSASVWIAIAASAFAVGLLLLAWILFSKLTAVGATSDRAFAAGIDTVGTLAAQATSPETISALTSIRADLEKRRGQAKR